MFIDHIQLRCDSAFVNYWLLLYKLKRTSGNVEALTGLPRLQCEAVLRQTVQTPKIVMHRHRRLVDVHGSINRPLYVAAVAVKQLEAKQDSISTTCSSSNRRNILVAVLLFFSFDFLVSTKLLEQHQPVLRYYYCRHDHLQRSVKLLNLNNYPELVIVGHARNAGCLCRSAALSL